MRPSRDVPARRDLAAVTGYTHGKDCAGLGPNALKLLLWRISGGSLRRHRSHRSIHMFGFLFFDTIVSKKQNTVVLFSRCVFRAKRRFWTTDPPQSSCQERLLEGGGPELVESAVRLSEPRIR